MTIRQIPAHLEVYFWTVVIRLICESKIVQYMVKEGYRFKSAQLSSMIRLGLVISTTGMLIGICLGLLGV